jgi:hypothetical protein
MKLFHKTLNLSRHGEVTNTCAFWEKMASFLIVEVWMLVLAAILNSINRKDCHWASKSLILFPSAITTFGSHLKTTRCTTKATQGAIPNPITVTKLTSRNSKFGPIKKRKKKL